MVEMRALLVGPGYEVSASGRQFYFGLNSILYNATGAHHTKNVSSRHLIVRRVDN